MEIRLPSILLIAKQILRTQSVSDTCRSNVPKGHFAVYVGEIQRKRFLVPISYLNHPSFVDLLDRIEGRVWIQPSNRRIDHSLQRRSLH